MAELEDERARSRAPPAEHPAAVDHRPPERRRALIADRYDDVAVVFSDFVGFTEISARLPGRDACVVAERDVLGVRCGVRGARRREDQDDRRCLPRRRRTPGGLEPAPDPGACPAIFTRPPIWPSRCSSAVDAAGPPWQIRIGIHRGPGHRRGHRQSKFVYDLWGDAVNVASRLEASSEPGRIQVSASTAAATAGPFIVEPRGQVDLKGKGVDQDLLPRRPDANRLMPSGAQAKAASFARRLGRDVELV